MQTAPPIDFSALVADFDGDLLDDRLSRILYATDASIYREMPVAVAYPRHAKDIQRLVVFAREHHIPLIPRTAGTSLAGQCVGNGIVVDVSRYMNQILELNNQQAWVRVQPGVIRDELNAFLRPHGLFFGPNTSTASRCMIGGMVGNNSSGTTSIKYGVTRDHVMELHTVLSDGSSAVFSSLHAEDFHQKRKGDTLESRLYQQIFEELSDPGRQQAIREQYPKPRIHRRNTGYAVDMLLRSNIFEEKGPDFNFCQILAGSEGTLAFTTEIKLHLNPLPPPQEVLICAHFNSLDEALRATLVAMQHQPYACELMDKFILDCTKENREQQRNRFFLEDDPAAILIIECRGETREEATEAALALIADVTVAGFGYAFPLVYPPDVQRVYALRAAGFGVLSNVKGESKPLEFVEDTAVDLPDLPSYIAEFQQLMAGFGQPAVYYAHAGAGELHIRPSLNLKSAEGVRQLRGIAEASARLVKKYQGSLSGEHGDGRVRGEFVPMMIGQDNYEFLRRIKQTWDPAGIFNPGKIVDAPPMDTSLRYVQGAPPPAVDTVFDFSATGGLLRTVEKCSGSGDCRKLSHVSGGVMCPSYMATRNEKHSTRARANALRELLTRSPENPLAHDELYEVMDLCLSCKGCASECPSSVDMAALKAEFLHHYYQQKGVPWRTRAIAHIDRLNALAMKFPRLSRLALGSPFIGGMLKRQLDIHPSRSLPPLHPFTLRRWYDNHHFDIQPTGEIKGRVFFFCDEFTNYYDVDTGIKALQLLGRLGYQTLIIDHAPSGRAYLSKGLLKEAQRVARKNIATFRYLVSETTPLIGLEPSAILGFRDEYPRLAEPADREAAKKLGQNALLFEEFFAREAQSGRITSDSFTDEPRRVLLHAHCHQKALSDAGASAFALSLPANYSVQLIAAGCCGMAGSFGYEKEHYDVSMSIGELALLPAVRQAATDAIIAAPGTSCRHQIFDGTGRKALHPVEVLWGAVK
ncbi:MAG: FAD-binding protein [Saprospiraceae bacterium]|nr:FAD-binding protein [Saprospiraceae bacterium]